MKNPLEHFLIQNNFAQKLETVNWEDIDNISEILFPVLDKLKLDDTIITDTLDFIENPENNFRLLDESEYFKRILLFEPISKNYSCRLLSMKPLDNDIAHNHRASFGTLIIEGGYKHYIYQQADNVLTKQFESYVSKNSIYFLHHSAIHSTISTSNHVSFQIRGKSLKEVRDIYFIDNLQTKQLNGGSDNLTNNLIENSDKIINHFRTNLKK